GSAGPAPARSRSRAGGDGGPVRRADAGSGGGSAGDLQVRRCPAGAGAWASTGASGLPVGGRGGTGVGDPGASPLGPAEAWRADRPAGRRGGKGGEPSPRSTSRPPWLPCLRRSRLPHLHLGTTGQPKAVQVEHGMLAATLSATRDLFHFAA